LRASYLSGRAQLTVFDGLKFEGVEREEGGVTETSVILAVEDRGEILSW
jgi:hypothetical protein